MNKHSLDRSPTQRLGYLKFGYLSVGYIALAALAVALSPINVHIVIAQDGTEIVVQAADPGEPPKPTVVVKQGQSTTESAAEVAVESSAEVNSKAVSEEANNQSTSEVNSEAEVSALAATANVASEAEVAKEQPQAPESVRTLSVEPGVKPILPADRPAWVGAAPDFTSAQHYLYVGSLPTAEEGEADEALDEPLLAAVRNYIDQEVVNEQGASMQMPVDVEYIRRNLIDDPRGYVCELATSQGAMYQKWVTARITPDQRELFKQWHVEAKQRTRLVPLGVNLVSALVLVSLLHLVLRRFNRSTNLPSPSAMAAQAAPQRRTMFGTVMKAMIFLGFLMLPAVLLLAALAPTTVRVQHGNVREAIHVNLHNSVGAHTLDGTEIRILEHTSGQ